MTKYTPTQFIADFEEYLNIDALSRFAGMNKVSFRDRIKDESKHHLIDEATKNLLLDMRNKLNKI
jgi:hypothetical protein